MIGEGERRDGLAEAARQRVGSILNRKWRLDSLLGMGGMAAVYAATHRNGHRVAIKLLHPHFCLDESQRARLQQEGYVANSIDHPGALRILDDDRAEDGAVFLVMELLSGEGLDARLKRKGWRLPRHEALAITGSVLEVLAAAHAKGIVHRDIKPDNVFITRNGEVKVLDFGIARMLTTGPLGASLSAAPLFEALGRGTHHGALFGTLGFMAPEQALARSHDVDGRTDLWATGAMLFTLMSGRLVHEAPTANEQLVNAATRRAPSLSLVMPEVDAPLAALVDRALTFEREQRWQSASEMLEALRAVAEIAVAGEGKPAPLQVPRISVEIDLEPVIRRGWSSSQNRGLSDSVPAPTSLLSRPRSGVSRLFVTLGTAAVVVVLGTGWLRLRHSDGAGSPASTLVAPAAADDQGPRPVLPIAVERAEAAPAVAAAAAVARPAAQVERSVRRPARGKGRVSVRRRQRAAVVAPAASVTTDDDIWGRRH